MWRVNQLCNRSNTTFLPVLTADKPLHTEFVDGLFVQHISDMKHAYGKGLKYYQPEAYEYERDWKVSL